MLYRILLTVIIGTLCTGAWADAQSDRKAFVEKLIDQGVFQKVEAPGSMPQLWVTPTFHRLAFDTKSSFVNVLYGYYKTANPKYDTVVLYDSRTEKEIGKYSKSYGGLRLK